MYCFVACGFALMLCRFGTLLCCAGCLRLAMAVRLLLSTIELVERDVSTLVFRHEEEGRGGE